MEQFNRKIEKIKKYIKKENIIEVGILIIIGWIVYSPLSINYLTNPDGVSGIIYKSGSEGAEFGRIGIGYIDNIFGRVVSPSLMLVVSLFLLSVGIVLIGKIFDFDESYVKTIGVLGLFLLFSPCISSTLTYYYCMVSYCLAFLLSTLAIGLVIENKNFKLVLMSGLLISISLTLYQAYLSVSVTLCMLYIIYMILNEKSTRQVLYTMTRFLVAGGIGVFSYLGIIGLLSIPLSENRSFNEMGRIDIKLLPGLIKETYYNFFEFYFGNDLLNNSWMMRDYLNGFVFIILIIEVLYVICIKKIYKHKVNLILLCSMCFLLPIGFELITIIAPGVDSYGSTGVIIVPAMFLIYIFPIVISSCIKIDKIKRVLSVILGINLLALIWNYIVFTYAFENVMWLNYNKTITLCNKISNAIENELDLQPGMKLVIGGDAERGNYSCEFEELEEIVKGSLAVKGMVWNGYLANWGYIPIMRNYLGLNYETPSVEEYNTIIESEEYSNMGILPNQNCVKLIDDIIVVKLSEN